MKDVLRIKLKVAGEVIIDKVVEGWSLLDIQQNMATYIQEERLCEMGEVVIQVLEPAKA